MENNESIDDKLGSPEFIKTLKQNQLYTQNNYSLTNKQQLNPNLYLTIIKDGKEKLYIINTENNEDYKLNKNINTTYIKQRA